MEEVKNNINGDVWRVVVKHEEVLPEQQERSSCLNLEEPAHIKEEQEELWISQEREQLQGAEEDDIIMFKFNPANVKSEDDDDGQLESSQSEKNQDAENRYTGYLKTESDGEDWGVSGADREFDPESNFHPEEISQLSGSDTDDSAEWEERDEPQDDLNKDRAVKDMKFNPRNTSDSSRESVASFGQKEQKQEHEEMRAEDKPFGCSVCGKRYPGMRYLQKHMLRHSLEKPFSCSFCEKSFLSRPEMVKHMRVHTGEEPFGCSVCGKRFKWYGSLKSHSHIHTGEKLINCSVCGKSFYDHRSLKAHSIVHTEETPYSCLICGKSFSHSGSLKKHAVVHTGEKPFSCPICGKHFALIASLNRHTNIHTGVKPFSCSVCGKGFSQPGNLRRHSVVHIERGVLSCSICDRTFAKLQYMKAHKCGTRTRKSKVNKSKDSHQM